MDFLLLFFSVFFSSKNIHNFDAGGAGGILLSNGFRQRQFRRSVQLPTFLPGMYRIKTIMLLEIIKTNR